MPIWFLSSSGTVGGTLPKPIANPDSFVVPLNGIAITLDILGNDNLRGELPSAVILTLFTAGLDGTADDTDEDNNVIYIPPTTGVPRTTNFEYTVTGIAGVSNDGIPTLVTIQLVAAFVSTIYEAGIYEPGIYE